MFNTQKGLTGSRVYGSGTTSPNRGPVSAAGAQGYLQREMRKPGNNAGLYGGSSRYGNDGKSDTRSGVAGAALRRQQGFQQGNGGTPRPGQPDPKPRQPTFQQGNGQPTRGNTNDTPFGHGTDPTSGQGDPVTPTTPPVVVNDAGQLELPYSPAWNAELLQNLSEFNQDLMALNMEEQQGQLDYTQALGITDREYTDTKRGTLSEAGAAGSVFSSGYANKATRNATDYNNTRNEMAAQRSQAAAATLAERTGIVNNFQQQAQQAALAYAAELEEQAGQLGYGDGQPGGNGTNGWQQNGPHPQNHYDNGNGGPTFVQGNGGNGGPRPTFQQGPPKPGNGPGKPRNHKRAAQRLMRGKR